MTFPLALAESADPALARIIASMPAECVVYLFDQAQCKFTVLSFSGRFCQHAVAIQLFQTVFLPRVEMALQDTWRGMFDEVKISDGVIDFFGRDAKANRQELVA